MKPALIRTVNLAVRAPRDTVFNFLADIENLPRWATEFCERVELRRGRWWALTSRGELLCYTCADDATGVIDLCCGPSDDEVWRFPIRVWTVPGATLVQFTFAQPPATPDEAYERQFQSLLTEMRGLLTRFGGGLLHAPEVSPEPAQHGAN